MFSTLDTLPSIFEVVKSKEVGVDSTHILDNIGQDGALL
jgi:hypothetical protein